MGCCAVERYGNWCDDVEILVEHEGKEYCIFHAPAECLEKFKLWDNDLVFRRINQAKKIENETCNLSGAIFPMGISFEKYDDQSPLPATTFSGSVFTRYAGFSGAAFSEITSFSGAVFSENADFGDAAFTRSVSFWGAAFIGHAAFRKAVFSEGAGFSGAVFSGGVDFGKAVFSENAAFGMAAFSEDADFRMAVFSEDADFMTAVFSGDVVFEACFFGGKSFFLNSNFTNARFDYAHFKGSALFRQTFFHSGTFEGCQVDTRLEFDRSTLKGLSLLGAPIESFRFISCDWPKSQGRNIVYDARRVKGKGFFGITNLEEKTVQKEHEEDPNPYHLEDLFRRLKKVAKNESDEIMASDWHFNEKEMQRLYLKKTDLNLGWPGRVRNLFLLWILTAYKVISGYGEEPIRALLCLLGLVVTPYVGNWLITPKPFPVEAVQYLPLVKSGIIVATHPLWIAFWQLLITIQAALFGFALRNKFRR